MPSQHEEDLLIEFFLNKLSIVQGNCIEIGVNNFSPTGDIQCNTHKLLSEGWKGVWIDAFFDHPNVYKKFVTPENILEIFKDINSPDVVDFFSIDIDSTDWYVMQALLDSHYKFRLICTEVNGYHDKWADLIMPENHQRPTKSRCFGATLLAYQKLFLIKGYELVGVTSNGVNAFWVPKEDAALFEHAGDYDFHYRKTDIKNNWSRDHISDLYTTAEAQLFGLR
ncbi:hypothetical protein [Litoribrevibacter albus]|uniref:Methyltransferase FkbM domain-containing protein n=1 Tax=Litoribrevibacter albus TaxID=1473156 RepID=A0AA37W8P3_9GAMM|nr:hypothetical protein [Litoribrevibacter albus]GLQ32234.1 hypothetical protein GCM10007876_27130 [Litoribrevibacter albus]